MSQDTVPVESMGTQKGRGRWEIGRASSEENRAV